MIVAGKCVGAVRLGLQIFIELKELFPVIVVQALLAVILPTKQVWV